ncbi:glucohydrolase [Lactobacillus sp. S2-2]|uniref:glycoside hydrolase family 13 protein n=1 Tax=Lactobacillus sp. S2-2 TaxID=2692917 RepID=UPI001F2CD912|nr:alpha-glucosidase [Lactobacillus sp. S2-2]MCF6514575.1 glucohydrolase [Lactobacillus sp. S2-2]
MNTNIPWWKNDTFYQIYPRSFQDSNNDGIGDIQGIISRLDYLQDLHVDDIWLSPIYQSPMFDMGYDISDYQAIDPIFGTMDDFDELLTESKKRNMNIIMDLVVNHTSDQHKWFQEAISNPNSKYRDYYIFKTTSDGKEPNNWRAIFGGSTWDPVPNEPGTYYFHTFAKQQPDLNWENPKLRKEIYQMINWWLGKGIAGFRIDAITHIKKDLDWKSLPPDAEDGLASVVKKGRNRPGVQEFLNELSNETFKKYDAVTIGEAYGLTDRDLPKFVGKDGYFSMVFDFNYMNIDVLDVDEWFRGQNNWTVKELKKVIFKSQNEIKQSGGWYANVLENHDQPRVLSKLIKNKEYQNANAAKALGIMYYFLPGVPFIYQGQELGMKNFEREFLEDFDDISSINNYNLAIENGYSNEESLSIINNKSRDNARTPMQWNNSIYAGFSEHKPWLKMSDEIDGINVLEESSDNLSVLKMYQKLGEIRHDEIISSIITEGDLHEIYNLPDSIIGYEIKTETQSLIVLVNLSENPVELSNEYNGCLLINSLTNKSSDHITISNLSGYQALVICK